MAPFEALYDRRFRTPLSWSQTGERKVFGPDLVIEAEEKVKVIKTNLKVAQSRQKSCDTLGVCIIEMHLFYASCAYFT